MPAWMPVFLVMPAARKNSAAHPSHKGELRAQTKAVGVDFLQRIGTAIKQEGGGYLIELAALPVSGRLLMKPPTQHDLRDPTTKGEL